MRRLAGVAGALLAAALVACNKPAEQPQQAAAPAGPAPGTPEWKIQSAMSAAPSNISSAATIMDYPASDTGHVTQLRAGTNGWTCFPDMPMSPGNDPMCLDGQWTKWVDALLTHKTPQITAVGISYMLAGASDASNTNPFAMQPDSGKSWLNSGPHLMVLTPGPHAYDAVPSEFNNVTPYVMFKGTPYAHLMVPVGAASHTM